MKVLLGAFTHRITGSLTLLYQATRLMGGLTSRPCLKRNGQPCGLPQNDSSIECPPHGFRFYLHGKLEDALYMSYCDALRTMSTQGHASVYKNDDKRKNNENNLFTSIPTLVGEYSKVHKKFPDGIQPDGLTVCRGLLDRELFHTVRNGRVPNPNQNWNPPT